jgi:hypothetical protein
MVSVAADAQGRFAFAAVVPGTYVIRGRTAPVPGQQIAVLATQTITISDNDVSGIVLSGREPVRVSGRIEFDAPVTPAEIAALRIAVAAKERTSYSYMSDVQLDAAGAATFVTVGLLGSYRLLLQGLQDSWYVKTVLVNGQEQATLFREFAAGDTVAFVVSTHAAGVDGVVTGDDGRPCGRCLVSLTRDGSNGWEDPHEVSTRWTMIDGRFSFNGLRPGRYALNAIVDTPARRRQDEADSPPPPVIMLEDTIVTLQESERQTVVVKVSKSGGDQ